MIHINLLPENLRKTSKKELLTTGIFSIPAEIVIGIGGGAIIFIIILDLLFGSVLIFKSARGQFFVQKKRILLSDGKTTEVIANNMRDTQMKINGIQDILKGPTLVWSQQLNTVSDLIVKGVWLRRFTFENDNLLIQGSSISKTHNELERVQEYIANLNKDNIFTKFFNNVQLQESQHRKVISVDVLDFTLNAQIK